LDGFYLPGFSFGSQRYAFALFNANDYVPQFKLPFAHANPLSLHSKPRPCFWSPRAIGAKKKNQPQIATKAEGNATEMGYQKRNRSKNSL